MPIAPSSSSVGTVGAASHPATSRFASLNANAREVPGSVGGSVCEGTKPSGVCMVFVIYAGALEDRRIRQTIGSGRELDVAMARSPELRERQRDRKNPEGACREDRIGVRTLCNQARERDADRLADE